MGLRERVRSDGQAALTIDQDWKSGSICEPQRRRRVGPPGGTGQCCDHQPTAVAPAARRTAARRRNIRRSAAGGQCIDGLAVISKWWRQWPAANVGIEPGMAPDSS